MSPGLNRDQNPRRRKGTRKRNRVQKQPRVASIRHGPEEHRQSCKQLIQLPDSRILRA